LPFVEGGILMSLLVLGVLVAAAVRLPLAASVALVGLFALFHGHAHGAEMPHDASGLRYALGFMLSTAALHLAGIAIASALGHIGRPQWLRLIGASVAAFGGALFFIG
ncbi:MAG: HupE/UreJ family protein, partial [Gallionella sp.]|nr:HupE/UreJ family protein [Gallionella sp.]